MDGYSQFFQGAPMYPHVHQWIDPLDPPIDRAPYSPVIGNKRREMKYGRTYRCLECPKTLTTPDPPMAQTPEPPK